MLWSRETGEQEQLGLWFEKEGTHRATRSFEEEGAQNVAAYPAPALLAAVDITTFTVVEGRIKAQVLSIMMPANLPS